MREIIVTAGDLQTALRQAAASLSVTMDSCKYQVLEESDRRVKVRVSTEDTDQHLGDLLDKLSDKLLDIEKTEILSNRTQEDLKAQGLFDARSNLRGTQASRQLGPFCMEPLVEYYECHGVDPNDPALERITDNLLPVTPGQRIATTTKEILSLNRYLCGSSSGIDTRKLNGITEFLAARPGRVVCLDHKLFIIAADVDAQVKVTISNDRMEAKADIRHSRGSGRKPDWALIQKGLQELGVVFGLQKTLAEFAIHEAASDEDILDLVVAIGQAPVNGTDAQVEFLVEANSPRVDEFQVLPDGKIDYRKQIVIPMVEEGVVLARIHPPKPGLDGMDVTGKVVPCKPGEEKVLAAGDGAKFQSGGSEIVSTTHGQPVCTSASISVFPQFTVQGDVDFRSGNIKFDGNVLVLGSVLSGFEVHAKGDVSILNNIESAIVTAGRDLKVGGGIIGTSTGAVRCGRDLTALHLQNAWVEAEGNIVIRNSSWHSRIDCSGNLELSSRRGQMIGGEVTLMGSASIRQLGSPAGAITKLALGQDFLVRRHHEEAEAAFRFLQDNILKLENYLKPLMKQMSTPDQLDPEQRRRLKAVIDKHRELKTSSMTVEIRKRNLERMLQLPSNAKLRILDSLHPGCIISISGIRLMDQDQLGHSVIELDPSLGRLVVKAN